MGLRLIYSMSLMMNALSVLSNRGGQLNGRNAEVSKKWHGMTSTVFTATSPSNSYQYMQFTSVNFKMAQEEKTENPSRIQHYRNMFIVYIFVICSYMYIFLLCIFNVKYWCFNIAYPHDMVLVIHSFLIRSWRGWWWCDTLQARQEF